MYTQGETQIFHEPLLLCSAFTRLVQGHLKTLNHLSFSLLLFFHKSHQGHLKALNHLSFFLILCFCESGTAQAFPDFSTLGKASSSSSSSSAGLLHFSRLKSFLVYTIFWTPTQSSCSHFPPTCYTWTHLLSRMPPTTHTAFLQWHHPVYFRK